MKLLWILTFCLTFLMPLWLNSNPHSRESWRLHTYLKQFDYSGPGGSSMLRYNYHYSYNCQNPQLVDSVNVLRDWSWEQGHEQNFHTIYYTSSLQTLDDKYVIQQSYTSEGITYMESITKDFNDRFYSNAIFQQTDGVLSLSYRVDRTYFEDGKPGIKYYYRNPLTFQDGYEGYWKLVPEYDSTNLKTSETRYSSSDSLIWTPTYKIMYHYNSESLPNSFLVKEREPYCHNNFFWQPDIVDNRQIDSLTVMNYINNEWHRMGLINYTYNVDCEQNEISIFFSADNDVLLFYEGYFYDGISYYSNGFIRNNYLTDAINYMYPSSCSLFYTWIDENTPVTDEYQSYPPVLLSVNAYPNPFKSSLNISFTGKDKTPADISIYNIKGQLIRRWKDNKATELSWDCKDSAGLPVSGGMYLIKAKQGRNNTTAKVIKY